MVQESATMQLITLRDVLSFIRNHEPTGPSPLLCDNKAATQLSQNEVGTKGMKHIQRRITWLKEVIAERKMQMYFLSGERQLADIFTKPLPATRFHMLRRAMIAMG